MGRKLMRIGVVQRPVRRSPKAKPRSIVPVVMAIPVNGSIVGEADGVRSLKE
jgi:hypothetical protein